MAVALQHFDEAEVGDKGLALFVEKNVRRLQIARWITPLECR